MSISTFIFGGLAYGAPELADEADEDDLQMFEATESKLYVRHTDVLAATFRVRRKHLSRLGGKLLFDWFNCSGCYALVAVVAAPR
jgi:hypothetical protein